MAKGKIAKVNDSTMAFVREVAHGVLKRKSKETENKAVTTEKTLLI